MIAQLIRLLSPMKWTRKQERHFRYLLTKVPVSARTEPNCIFVRPENVGKFKELCEKEGLGDVDEVKSAINYLMTHPGESIRFKRVVK